MSAVAISLLSGVLAFFALYFSFSYWEGRIGSSLKTRRDETLAQYKELFVDKTPERVLREQLALSGGLALFILWFTWPQVGIGIPLGLAFFWYSWGAPLFYLKNIVKPSRVRKFSMQMVDALILMANGMKSGLEIQQALQIVVNEMPDPIRQEFGLVLSEIRVGKSSEEAFENLGKRIDSEDVRIFVTSIVILKETGGNINETFRNIATTIRERLKLQNKIQAMTAQGMTSAVIVGGLPWALGGMLYVTDPVAMRPLFTHPAGWLILLMVLILESIGFFVIMKIVRIKV